MLGRRRIEIKRPDEVVAMRRAGLVVARALAAARAAVRPGATTREVDAAAEDVIRGVGATPSFLGYGRTRGRPGFPAVTCVSVNEEIVHGIPGERVLADGDLVCVDCGAVVDGWHGDAALSVQVGRVSADVDRLDATTRAALWQGIGAARLGGRVGDISAAVEAFVVAQPGPYGIVEEYVGHGIGSAMHQPPDVPNAGRPGRGPRIVPGLCLAVEPMITLGPPDNDTLDDGWTVVATQAAFACHWEHTMTVTPAGTWVLTAEDGGEELLTRAGVAFGPLAD